LFSPLRSLHTKYVQPALDELRADLSSHISAWAAWAAKSTKSREAEANRREAIYAALVSEIVNGNARLQEDGRNRSHDIERLRREVELLRGAVGRVESRQLAAEGVYDADADRWDDAEFRAYTQSGEDGLYEYLIRRTPIASETFMEVGVEDYREANTRFLLLNRHWEGHVVDGSEEQVAAIRRQWIHFYERLTVHHGFVTAETIEGLLAAANLPEEFGLLSIDIDGNDYWVWKAVENYRPTLVSIEYNWRFGPDRAVTIPYDASFVRPQAHSSMLYFGCSLAALVRLGEAKGYAFVGCNANGVNAFFVRRDRLPDGLPTRTVAEGFRTGTFSEYRNEQGEQVKIGPAAEAAKLAELLGQGLPLIEDPDV
jgi:hypothetical protein